MADYFLEVLEKYADSGRIKVVVSYQGYPITKWLDPNITVDAWADDIPVKQREAWVATMLDEITELESGDPDRIGEVVQKLGDELFSALKQVDIIDDDGELKDLQTEPETKTDLLTEDSQTSWEKK